ncbi:MAG: class I tRNA ligase family protein [Coriobacteriia bacterium]|nr:class I tRNA ligase family protein [Coriobacteriia bacterium]
MQVSKWPKRAVVTAGMPYGNKALHFGHIGGVFIPADCFARFLKDRIGKDNVKFVSGTDCYGSPIDEGYRKLEGFDGTIQDYVKMNHDAQLETLKKYEVDLSIFEGSGIGKCGEAHQKMTDDVLSKLKDLGVLTCVDSKQFYDTQADMFLNGRQVTGRCPVQGCKSEQAYADECSLGHQYAPEDLIAPKSSVTSTTPEMRTVKNWYFDLPKYLDFLKSEVERQKADANIRDIVPQTISEFLVPPIIFVKNECYEDYKKLDLPKHSYKPAEGNKQSFTIEFENIYDRDEAKEKLVEAGIRFRTGKTLVPFRLTGNATWGVSAKALDPELTVWCWPESLWAPISFTSVIADWEEYWCGDDTEIYQFIGQDNIYFYGVAQPAIWEALGNIKQSRLIANHHVLFGKTKASSSSEIKPPSADELLDYYTAEQLRAHFLALGLAQKSVGFSPKVFDAEKKDDPRVADPVLKEGALLTNVYNRLARSCFYEAKNNFDCKVELLEPSTNVKKLVSETMDKYEALMHKVELYSIMQLMDTFIRDANKIWTDGIKAVSQEELSKGIDVRVGGEPSDARKQVLADSFYLLYATNLMMHPIVPSGAEKVLQYMKFDDFNWDNFRNIVWNGEVHEVEEIPPRFDFFKKHESQYK